MDSEQNWFAASPAPGTHNNKLQSYHHSLTKQAEIPVGLNWNMWGPLDLNGKDGGAEEVADQVIYPDIPLDSTGFFPGKHLIQFLANLEFCSR